MTKPTANTLDHFNCPHCDYTYTEEAAIDLLEPAEWQGDFLMDCDDCGKPMKVSFELHASYTTAREEI